MELINSNIKIKKLNLIYIEYIIKILSKFINKIWIYKEDITISIKINKENTNFLYLFKFLKNHFFFIINN